MKPNILACATHSPWSPTTWSPQTSKAQLLPIDTCSSSATTVQVQTMASKSPPQSRSPTLLRRVINLDTAVSLHLYTFFQPILPFSFLKSLELSGDGRLFFPIILSILLTTTPIATLTTTFSSPSTLLLLNLLIGSLLDLLLIGLIKHLIQRPRPVYNKNMFLSFAVDHWSFPSGHSSRVSFIATFCFFYSNHIREALLTNLLNLDAKSAIVEYFAVLVGVWAAITSVSRVLLGRHFVLDVVAGGCLGVLEGLLVFRALNYENLSSWFRWYLPKCEFLPFLVCNIFFILCFIWVEEDFHFLLLNAYLHVLYLPLSPMLSPFQFIAILVSKNLGLWVYAHKIIREVHLINWIT